MLDVFACHAVLFLKHLMSKELLPAFVSLEKVCFHVSLKCLIWNIESIASGDFRKWRRKNWWNNECRRKKCRDNFGEIIVATMQKNSKNEANMNFDPQMGSGSQPTCSTVLTYIFPTMISWENLWCFIWNLRHNKLCSILILHSEGWNSFQKRHFSQKYRALSNDFEAVFQHPYQFSI